MQKIVIIVAGGVGKRMNSNIPKQFMLLGDIPVLMHTIRVFTRYDKDIGIRLVLPEEETESWKRLCRQFHFTVGHQVYKGGETRFHSVLNGLEGITGSCLVAVHDGVRPLVSVKTITNCFLTAEEKGTAVPVLIPKESIREIAGENSVSCNRELFRVVQTPQVFQSEIILHAYNTEYRESFTDDASVVEQAGYKIYLTEGNEENIKITSPLDLRIAEALYRSGKH
jgi:2-C-methyl-D-erythritol 4-phosphate cytidylyltransferase